EVITFIINLSAMLRLYVLLLICFSGVALLASAIDPASCTPQDPAPANFSGFDPRVWAGRCVRLYVSLSAQRPDARVCGTETYRSDSDLVSAAIHAGLFSGYSFAASTVVEFGQALTAYKGSRRYGVASSDCGDYAGSLSFRFPAHQFPSPPSGSNEIAFYYGMLATLGVVGNTDGVVIGGASSGRSGDGLGVYAASSDVGAAAVHAGLLAPGESQPLRIWFLPRRRSFYGGFGRGRGSGMTSRSSTQPDWSMSFPEAARTIWGEAPTSLELFGGADGVVLRFRLACCSSRQLPGVRGSGVYHVGSNFAASARHAGLVQPNTERILVVEFLGKTDSFAAGFRNGVMSERFGPGYAYRFLDSELA
ncbi:hypothetical protein BOX15_Mlig018192g2, partial [Macrostomum lignano]